MPRQCYISHEYYQTVILSNINQIFNDFFLNMVFKFHTVTKTEDPMGFIAVSRTREPYMWNYNLHGPIQKLFYEIGNTKYIRFERKRNYKSTTPDQ